MTWDASYQFLSHLFKPLLRKSASDCSLRFIITLTELRHDEVRQIGHCRVVEHDLGKLKGRVVVFHIKTKKNPRANALKSRIFLLIFCDAIWFNHVLWSIFHFELLKATVSIFGVQLQSSGNQDTVDAKCKPSKEACKRSIRLLRAWTWDVHCWKVPRTGWYGHYHPSMSH